jgi:hypothetical protein
MIRTIDRYLIRETVSDGRMGDAMKFLTIRFGSAVFLG